MVSEKIKVRIIFRVNLSPRGLGVGGSRVTSKLNVTFKFKLEVSL